MYCELFYNNVCVLYSAYKNSFTVNTNLYNVMINLYVYAAVYAVWPYFISSNIDVMECYLPICMNWVNGWFDD